MWLEWLYNSFCSHSLSRGEYVYQCVYQAKLTETNDTTTQSYTVYIAMRWLKSFGRYLVLYITFNQTDFYGTHHKRSAIFVYEWAFFVLAHSFVISNNSTINILFKICEAIYDIAHLILTMFSQVQTWCWSIPIDSSSIGLMLEPFDKTISTLCFITWSLIFSYIFLNLFIDTSLMLLILDQT